MSVQNSPFSSYHFGPFHVDAPAGQLRKRGSKIRLAGQPFEILVMLLERPGQVVTREEIQRRLWPDQTFVDFENSLNKAINKLRQALSDSAEEPVYIETLPRRGYRFVGSIVLPEPLTEDSPKRTIAPALESIPAQTSSPPVVSSRKFPIWKMVALLVFASAAIVIWLGARPLREPRVLRATSLTDSSRVDPYGVLHSDGVRLFFLLRYGSRWELAQMPASGGEVQPVSTPFPNAKMFSISPDGSQFALGPFDSRVRALPVWLMSSVGGTARRLGEFLANDAIFTRDGSRITYSTPEGIFEIGIDGGNSHMLSKVVGLKWGLVWSPDGTRLRFHWFNASGPSWRIWEIRSDGTNLHQILSNWTGGSTLCCGQWSADGRYFFFVADSQKSPGNLWALREPHGIFRRQESPIRMSTDPVPVSVLLPSSDGKKIYLLGNKLKTEYVRADPRTREIHGLLGGQNAAWLAVSPVGGWAVFRGSGDSLWRANLDGTTRTELAKASMQAALPAVRHDGKLIAFRGQPPGVSSSRVYLISPDGGEATEVASASYPLEVPAWTPDGKKLSYVLDAGETPSSGVYLLDLTTRSSQKIPGSENCMQHSWSPDGKYLACISRDISKVYLCDLATWGWKVVAQGKVFSPVLWGQDSGSLFFQDLLEDGEPVKRFRARDGSIQRVFECSALLEGGVHRCALEGVTPEGYWLLKLSRGDHDVYSLDVDLP